MQLRNPRRNAPRAFLQGRTGKQAPRRRRLARCRQVHHGETAELQGPGQGPARAGHPRRRHPRARGGRRRGNQAHARVSTRNGRGRRDAVHRQHAR